MLQNNLDPEVAERPEDLVVYGGTGKAARDWAAFDAMIRTLTTLRDDETMLVQSGRPVGVMRTHEWAPRVLIANSNLVGDWATWPEFRRLEALGLTMYGQMTAGSWIYIGTQGILQGTYETFAAVAAKRFNGTLAGTLTVTGGCGGMGGAQPLAVTMNDGVCLIIDVDRTRLRAAGRPPLPGRGRRRPGRRDRGAARRPRRPGERSRSAWSATARPCCPSCCAGASTIDIVTDQTSAHDPLSYLPEGDRPGRLARLRRGQAGGVHRPRAGLDGQARRGDGRLPGRRRRGLRLRQLDPRRGPHRAATSGRSPSRASSRRTSGRCSARARARSAGRRCPATRRTSRVTDQAVLDLFPDNDHLHRWIRAGPGAGRVPGPAGADLLARVRRAGQGRAGASTTWSPPASRRADRDRPRPPGLRLGRLAVPRDRGDGRRLGRHRRLAAAQRPGQHRRPARPGCRSTTVAASASAARSTPARSAWPTAPSWPRRSSTGC